MKKKKKKTKEANSAKLQPRKEFQPQNRFTKLRKGYGILSYDMLSGYFLG